MAVTSTETNELRDALNRADPTDLADVLRKVKLGRMLDPVKVTVSSISAASSVDLTTLSKGDSEVTIDQGLADLSDGDALPPALVINTLRVTAGAAQDGPRVVTDEGGTAAAGGTGLGGSGGGVATISDDGKTITFEGNVTGFVIEYVPRADNALSGAYNRST